MKMELIQPFINAADAVLAETLRGATRIEDVSMEPEVYRRKGLAALVSITGDVEGRVIFDLEDGTALKVARKMAGADLHESDDLVRESIAELANQVIGNAVTTLNDQGFRFKVCPPEILSSDEGLKGNEDTEALLLCFVTPNGPVYMNIAMHYNERRHGERGTVV